MRELLEAAHARADVTVITDAMPRDRRTSSSKRCPEWLSPLVAVIPAQQLAVGMAERLGRDVDRPPGLQKVTLTA